MHYSYRAKKLNIVSLSWITVLAILLSLGGCGGGGGGSGSGTGTTGGIARPSPSSSGSSGQPADGPVISLTWQLPSFNEDGSCVDDLAGFRFNLGTSPGSYSYRGTTSLENTNCAPIGPQTGCGAVMRCTYDVSGLPPTGSIWHVSIQAFDTSGNFSGHSNEIRIAARQI